MDARTIPLSKLNVDLANFRIGEFDTAREAYRAMAEVEGEKLVRLADDIVTTGLSPVDPLIVGVDPDRPGQFIVFEGNRRVTALKLMHTPALAIGTDQEKAFARLARSFAAKPIRELSCVIMKDKASALIWIKRKHTSDAGRGISEWGAEAQARFEAFQGAYRPSKAVMEHLKKARKLDPAIAEKLKSRTTNVDRVLQMPYVRSALGIVVGKDGEVSFENDDKHAGNDLLSRMLQKLSTITVDKIKSADQRRDFIDSFAKYSVASELEEERTSGPTKATTKNAKRAVQKADRRTLAPTQRGMTFAVTDPRLRELYKECKELNPEKFPQTASILIRVFLELSTERYLTLLRVPLPPHPKLQGKQWHTFGVSLHDKVGTALPMLDPGMKAADLKPARRGLSDDDYMHSISELHQYVHAMKADIVGREVKTVWDRWHPYLSRIYAGLNEA